MSCRTNLAAALTLALALIGTRAPASGPAPATAPFPLSTCNTCSQSVPAVAGTPSGKFMVAFDVKLLEGATVQARLYNATGKPVAAPFRVQALATPPQYDAAVASNAAGAFVIAWSTTDGIARNSDVWAQRYDATGKAVGVGIRVNIDAVGTTPLDTLPTVAMAADGSFTVAWLRIVPPGGSIPSTGYQVWARRFSAAAVPVGAPPV